MKRSAFISTLLTCSVIISCQKKIAFEEEKTLYSFGTKLGSNLKGLNLSEDEIDVISAGFRDAALDHVRAKNYENFQDAVQAEKIQKLVDSKRDAQRNRAFKEGKAAYDQFLASGALKTDSGLLYKTVKDGDGEFPSETDLVEMNYSVSLADGRTIRSTKTQGETVLLPVNRLLSGWSEGVKLMRRGAQLKMILPPELAYGENGNPPEILGNSFLVLEVDLVSIKPGPQSSAEEKKVINLKSGKNNTKEHSK